MTNIIYIDYKIQLNGFAYTIEQEIEQNELMLDIFSVCPEGHRFDTTFTVNHISINDVIQESMSQLLTTLNG
jgi:hypothetical protein